MPLFPALKKKRKNEKMKKRIKRKKMGGKILKNQAPVRPKNMFVEKRFIKKINC